MLYVTEPKQTAVFFRSIAQALRQGAGLYEIVALTLPSVQHADKVLTSLYQGSSLSQALSCSESFSTQLLRLISIAEQENQLVVMLDTLADDLEKQVRKATPSRLQQWAPTIVCATGSLLLASKTKKPVASGMVSAMALFGFELTRNLRQ